MRELYRTLPLSFPLDLSLTLGPLRRGSGDPTMRVDHQEMSRATRTPEGIATLHLRVHGARLEATAWGPGAGYALDRIPQLVGVGDRPDALRTDNRLIKDLQKRLVGLRIGRTEAVLEALIPAILEQKVTNREAWRAHRGLVRHFGDVAPGPHGLRTPPDPEAVAAQPYYALHPLGIERKRAEVIKEVCRHALSLEDTAGMPPASAAARLRAYKGIGEWTIAEVAARAFGDPDAVSVGDYHLPHLVTWVLAGQPRGDDKRMLELLEPFEGQRGRVIRLLEAGGKRPPRRGPRMTPRDYSRI